MIIKKYTFMRIFVGIIALIEAIIMILIPPTNLFMIIIAVTAFGFLVNAFRMTFAKEFDVDINIGWK